MMPAQFVCPLKFDSMSLGPGDCSRCGVPRLPLAEESVRDSVFQWLQRQVDKRRSRRQTLIWGLAAIPALIVYAWFAGDSRQLFHGKYRLAAFLYAVLGVALSKAFGKPKEADVPETLEAAMQALGARYENGGAYEKQVTRR